MLPTQHLSYVSVCLWSQLVGSPGGHSSNSVVHMRDQGNTKKGCFFEAKCKFARILIRGQNMPILEKKCPLGFYLGALKGSYFYSTKYVLPKSLFRGKFGGKIAQKSCLVGVFPGGEIVFRVCFENLWSCICTTLVFKWPPWVGSKEHVAL